MKKLLLLLVMLLGMITPSVAQQNDPNELWYITNYLNIDTGNGWTGWTETECQVKFNFDNKHIVIFSDSQQIFDFVSSDVKYCDWGTKFSMYCTDTNYTTCLLELFVYKKGYDYIKITYSDITYKYQIEPIN